MFEPAYIILQNYVQPWRFWIVVRGTCSIEDLLTDIAAEPVKFMDGYVHKGLFVFGVHVRASKTRRVRGRGGSGGAREVV